MLSLRKLLSPLRLVPRRAAVRILFGPLRGKKWIAGSSVNRCWLGLYESEKARRFQKAIKPNSVVYDIGAHAGYYTMIASVLAGPEGRVFAFEPAPRNIAYLREHLRLNRLSNASVLELAISDKTGKAGFNFGPASQEGHLDPHGEIQVQAITLDEWTAAGKFPPPDCIKIDVEGGEFRVLSGAKQLLKTACPIVFLAIDKPNLHQPCTELLRSLGYVLEPLNAKTIEEASEIIARKCVPILEKVR